MVLGVMVLAGCAAGDDHQNQWAFPFEPWEPPTLPVAVIDATSTFVVDAADYERFEHVEPFSIPTWYFDEDARTIWITHASVPWESCHASGAAMWHDFREPPVTTYDIWDQSYEIYDDTVMVDIGPTFVHLSFAYDGSVYARWATGDVADGFHLQPGQEVEMSIGMTRQEFARENFSSYEVVDVPYEATVTVSNVGNWTISPVQCLLDGYKSEPEKYQRWFEEDTGGWSACPGPKKASRVWGARLLGCLRCRGNFACGPGITGASPNSTAN